MRKAMATAERAATRKTATIGEWQRALFEEGSFMGYQHRARKVACPKCKKQVAWFWDSSKKVPDTWACDCGVTNHIKPLPEWPPVPRTLYIGPDKLARLKVFPLPPESPNERWAQPYSIRSFVSQASEAYGGCHYTCKQRGEVMGEIVFTDGCYDDDTVNEEWSEPDTSAIW